MSDSELNEEAMNERKRSDEESELGKHWPIGGGREFEDEKAYRYVNTINLASMMGINDLPTQPPPEYEPRITLETPPNSASCSTTPESKSNERLSSLSRSQPDLTRFGEELGAALTRRNNEQNNTHHFYYAGLNDGSPHIQQNIIEILRAENSNLRLELDTCFRKISKYGKLELEIQKIHLSHEELMRSAEKKEKLERTVRYKLEIEIKRLQQQNKTLREQINAALATIAATKRVNEEGIEGNDMKTEIQKRDAFIAELLAQNRELLNDKERQEIELQAQRLTLEEQRNHIETLDHALTVAQNNVIKLEAEARKQQSFEEKANHLQKALINLQLVSDRKLKMEQRVRTHLENEIRVLKNQLNGSKDSTNNNNSVSSSSSGNTSGNSNGKQQQQLQQ